MDTNSPARSIRIGNGCGFWGDSLDAPARLARDGRLDYLTLEYLAELTMSILALLRQRDPNAGYATDFVDVLPSLAPELLRQPRLKIVTNAGGMNPYACAAKARDVLRRSGVATGRIGIVTGDDLLPRLDALLAAGHEFRHLDTGEPLARIRERIVAANAYLGAAPVRDALARGATIVITGRVADAALAMGPLLHEFGWPLDDWHRLGAGVVAGHLIECGAQMTGGLWCNGEPTTGYTDIGYPIAEVAADGSMVVTKPDGTGGAVNVETVSEQLLYEVGDPAAYLTPDVVADFTTLRIRDAGRHRVAITGCRGKPATDSLKVSIAYRDGYTSSGTLVIAGPNAAVKARFCGQLILDRLARAGFRYANSHVEALGAGDCVPGVLPMTSDPPEVVLRVAVRDPDKAAVARFGKEFAPLVTSGPPGVTGYTTGRPSVRETFAYWPALVHKAAVPPHVEYLELGGEV